MGWGKIILICQQSSAAVIADWIIGMFHLFILHTFVNDLILISVIWDLHMIRGLMLRDEMHDLITATITYTRPSIKRQPHFTVTFSWMLRFLEQVIIWIIWSRAGPMWDVNELDQWLYFLMAYLRSVCDKW